MILKFYQSLLIAIMSGIIWSIYALLENKVSDKIISERIFMHTIAVTDIKQNFIRLQEALCDDILITKKDKPFVVVMDYDKYMKLNLDSDEEWSYWSDNEIDNFSKIALGLSKNDFDDEDEDYSAW